MGNGSLFIMKLRFIFIGCLVLACAGMAIAQLSDTLPQTELLVPDAIPLGDSILAADSLREAVLDSPKRGGFLHRVFKENYPNPNMALYLSLAVPGGGQIYNKRWWKLPIVYAAYGGLIYSASYNQSYYRRLRDAYIADLNGKPHEFPRIKGESLRRLRDSFDKNRQLSYLGIFGLHLLQSAEAFVDCHLRTFDVSDDLSLRLKPSIAPSGIDPQPVLGLGIALSFRQNSSFIAPVAP